MKFLLNLNQSLDAIRANIFRAGVTILIIALGITALVVVMTSIEGIKAGMSQSFSSLGSNTFNIMNVNNSLQVRGRRKGRRIVKFPRITYREASQFQKNFDQFGISSASVNGTSNAIVQTANYRTNPNVTVTGTDELYLETSKFVLAEGRGLSSEDIALGRNVVVIGSDIRELLFPHSSSIGQNVTMNNQVYEVVGAFEKVGTTGISGTDRTALIPISTLRRHYPNFGSITLNVFVEEAQVMDFAMEEAQGQFRIIRGLRVDQEDNFSISRSDAFVNQFLDQISVVTLVAQIIAFITLMGASIALLNVMLVSVTERTSEIGLRKAMGATKGNILLQFLMEAIVICQVGGMLGIMMGILGGNIVSSLAFEGEFVIPWVWVFIGFLACLVVGIGSGYYPAWKAAKIDPIESLRHI
ncbi:MAG: ABC transporter permease [Bacteroidota bacterium]